MAFKNISNTAFTPLAVKIIMKDSAGKDYNFPLVSAHGVAAGDTVQIGFLINVKTLPAGLYNFIMEVNPGNAQPEQYHFNNFLYKDLFINRPALPNAIQASAAETKTTASFSSVLPNPFTDKLVIKNNSNKPCVARLYSVNGQLLMQQSFTGNTLLNTVSIAAGTYILEIISGTNKETFTVHK